MDFTTELWQILLLLSQSFTQMQLSIGYQAKRRHWSGNPFIPCWTPKPIHPKKISLSHLIWLPQVKAKGTSYTCCQRIQAEALRTNKANPWNAPSEFLPSWTREHWSMKQYTWNTLSLNLFPKAKNLMRLPSPTSLPCRFLTRKHPWVSLHRRNLGGLESSIHGINILDTTLWFTLYYTSDLLTSTKTILTYSYYRSRFPCSKTDTWIYGKSYS